MNGSSPQLPGVLVVGVVLHHYEVGVGWRGGHTQSIPSGARALSGDDCRTESGFSEGDRSPQANPDKIARAAGRL